MLVVLTLLGGGGGCSCGWTPSPRSALVRWCLRQRRVRCPRQSTMFTAAKRGADTPGAPSLAVQQPGVHALALRVFVALALVDAGGARRRPRAAGGPPHRYRSCVAMSTSGARRRGTWSSWPGGRPCPSPRHCPAPTRTRDPRRCCQRRGAPLPLAWWPCACRVLDGASFGSPGLGLGLGSDAHLPPLGGRVGQAYEHGHACALVHALRLAGQRGGDARSRLFRSMATGRCPSSG